MSVAVTIRDVARQAQVSVATVSRALTSPDLVRATTRNACSRSRPTSATSPIWPHVA
ncbi:LacI family DNA-binding transcriptional regulator [Kutzneria chonburiensis]|uniref:LacI family DNA-binding transcriptional regulator n=1 Tax=Kutzneria chonburiensis TaxID=1483604 RepID=UPI0030813276